MIRFFISSTFKDMQAERDAIHRVIYPRIRDYGLEKGVSVDICDLRWGIDYNKNWSEEETINEIMNVCFAEVQDCKPHIVAIIGEKYGSRAPNEKSIIKLWSAFGKPAGTLPENTNISLTQWELEFSFLSEANSDTKALCLFRRGSRKKRDKEVDELEQRIIKKKKEVSGEVDCEEYSHLSEFEEKFIKYAERIIDEEAKSDASANWVEKELKYAHACCIDKCKEFAGRRKYLELFETFKESRENNVLALYGQSGIGKSSLMAKMYQASKERNENSEIILCGLSQIGSYYLNILIEIIYILENSIDNAKYKVRENIFTEENAERVIEGLLSKRNAGSDKLFIFVDAMDKLSVTGKNRLISLFEGACQSNVKLICSQIAKIESISDSKTIIKEVRPLTQKEITEILASHLFDSHQRNIGFNTPVIKALMEKASISSPLYIKAAINILKMHISELGAIQNKDRFFIELINKIPGTTTEICWHAFQEAFSFIVDQDPQNKNTKKQMLEQLIGVLSVARHGLRERDLESIFRKYKWKSATFAKVRLFLRDFFRYMQDGCWTFEHDIITRGILEHFGKTQNGVRNLKETIYKYVGSDVLPDEEVLIKEGLYLSFYFSDIELATRILQVIKDEPTITLREIAAKELASMLNEESSTTFLKKVVEKNESVVTGAVASMLEYVGRNDYPRRIPARNVADVLWKIMNISSREDINRWHMKSNRTFDEKLCMAMLCAEYVSVYDDSGDHIRAVAYSFFPKDFYESASNLGQLSFEQQQKAYKQMQALFNANNSVLSNINNFSMEIMDWFDSASKKLAIIERKTRNAFDGNIGQYYSAKGDLNLSIRRRFIKTINNIDALFTALPKEFDEERKLFQPLYNDLKKANISVLDIDFNKHRLFWDGVLNKIGANISNDSINNIVSERLDSVGRSYFVICYDIIKTRKEVEEYERIVEKGCESIEIAIDIFGNEFVNNRRELLSSYIRRLQINEKKQHIDEDKLETIMSWAMKTINDYLDGYDDYGFDLGFLLLKSLEKYDKHIKNAFNDKKTGVYYERIGQLHKKLYKE